MKAQVEQGVNQGSIIELDANRSGDGQARFEFDGGEVKKGVRKILPFKQKGGEDDDSFLGEVKEGIEKDCVSEKGRKGSRPKKEHTILRISERLSEKRRIEFENITNTLFLSNGLNLNFSKTIITDIVWFFENGGGAVFIDWLKGVQRRDPENFFSVFMERLHDLLQANNSFIKFLLDNEEIRVLYEALLQSVSLMLNFGEGAELEEEEGDEGDSISLDPSLSSFDGESEINIELQKVADLYRILGIDFESGELNEDNATHQVELLIERSIPFLLEEDSDMVMSYSVPFLQQLKGYCWQLGAARVVLVVDQRLKEAKINIINPIIQRFYGQLVQEAQLRKSVNRSSEFNLENFNLEFRRIANTITNDDQKIWRVETKRLASQFLEILFSTEKREQVLVIFASLASLTTQIHGGEMVAGEFLKKLRNADTSGGMQDQLQGLLNTDDELMTAYRRVEGMVDVVKREDFQSFRNLLESYLRKEETSELLKACVKKVTDLLALSVDAEATEVAYVQWLFNALELACQENNSVMYYIVLTVADAVSKNKKGTLTILNQVIQNSYAALIIQANQMVPPLVPGQSNEGLNGSRYCSPPSIISKREGKSPYTLVELLKRVKELFPNDPLAASVGEQNLASQIEGVGELVIGSRLNVSRVALVALGVLVVGLGGGAVYTHLSQPKEEGAGGKVGKVVKVEDPVRIDGTLGREVMIDDTVVPPVVRNGNVDLTLPPPLSPREELEARRAKQAAAV